MSNPSWQYFDPLLDNFNNWARPATQLMMGVGGSGNNSAALTASYGAAMANRARSKGREIMLWK